MAAARNPTWSDVKDDPNLNALSISIHHDDVVMTKEWIKPTMDPEHWKRIVKIAETPASVITDPDSAPGFSWVDAVVIGNGPGIALDPPEHLHKLLTDHTRSAHHG